MNRAWYYINLTNTCNKSCSYCVVKQWLNQPDKYPDNLKLDELIEFIERTSQGLKIYAELTGGEPTLSPLLLPLLAYLKSKEAITLLRTNGFGLREWRFDYPEIKVVLAKHNTPQEQFNMYKAHLLPRDRILEGTITDGIDFKMNSREPVISDKTLSKYLNRDEPLFAATYFITNQGGWNKCHDMIRNEVYPLSENRSIICMNPNCPYQIAFLNEVENENPDSHSVL